MAAQLAGEVDRHLVEWCRRHLGGTPVRVLMRTGHLSDVTGLELDDGRRVVVKVREGSDRLLACARVQAELFRQGFPCAEVLVEPAPLGDRVASAEVYVDRGDDPPSPAAAEASARLFADLVSRTPPVGGFPQLAAALPWVGWDHGGGEVWPAPDDLTADLNARSDHAGLDDAARRVQARLARVASDPVIAHADWEANNLAWNGCEPVAVHDWDSLAIRPESTAVGAAASVFPSFGGVVFASLDETERFLAAYAQIRPLTGANIEEAWAAGCWTLAYNAKKETAGGGRGYLAVAAAELDERLRRAHA